MAPTPTFSEQRRPRLSGCGHTEARCVVASCCRIVLLCCPIGSALGCFLHHPDCSGRVGVMQEQPPYKPNGVIQQHERAARRWLLRHCECVPSLRVRLCCAFTVPPEKSSASSVSQAQQCDSCEAGTFARLLRKGRHSA